MNSRRIVERFEAWRARSLEMALVTVYETIGSTYSKAGHRILIAANGEHEGLVSGGCLEGDLAERARGVVARGRSEAVTYDLRDEADELFGLGVGCNGLIRVLLQPLSTETGYEPFASIAACLLGDARGAIATIVESLEPGLEPGATLVVSGEALARPFGLPRHWLDRLRPGADAAVRSGRASLERHDGSSVLYAPIDPVPRLLLLGAGLDAVPLVNMASELGWRVSVADHRPAYVARGFAAAEKVLLVDADHVAAEIALERFDAIVVMSHHLATDEKYLASLAACGAPYVGVLGPPARRKRLLEALGAAGSALAPRLKGPVGLDIGADSPETIALSILAEINRTLAVNQNLAPR